MEVNIMEQYGFKLYSVGEKFDGVLVGEGGTFETRDNMCECTITLSNITDEEIKAVDKGPIYVSLSYIEDVIFVNINLNNVMSFNMPFNMALYKEFRLKNPGKQGYFMPVFLVDVDSSIIKAMRVLGFKNEFSQKLYELSKQQWEKGAKGYDEKVTRLIGTYTPKQLFENNVVYNVFGGSL